jgi:hypothetical protein
VDKHLARVGSSRYEILSPKIEEMRLIFAENSPEYPALTDQTFRVPSNLNALTAYGWWFVLNLIVPDCDYVKYGALKVILQQAIQRYSPGNQYELWIKFIWKFFTVEGSTLSGEELSHTYDPLISPYNPAELLEFLLENKSEDDVFGNFSILVAKIIKQAKNSYAIRKLRKPGKPKYPKRKRGYSDKGSRRDNHITPISREITSQQEAFYCYRLILRQAIQSFEKLEFNNWFLYPSRESNEGG